LFVPVGGGGLLAGIAAWVRQNKKKIKIVGVEVDDSACLAEAIKTNKRVLLKKVGLFADGVAVSQVGKSNLDVIKECVDEVMTVNIDEVCAAVKDIFEDTRILSEPSGAVALAGLKQYTKRIKNKNLLAVSSGANINFQKLGFIVERSELGENREKILSIKIPEKPGSFLKLAKVFGKLAVTEFNYRKAHEKDAHVLVGIRTTSEASFSKLKQKLKKLKYKFSDYTNNEISNDHLRHMVGGRASSNNDSKDLERIFNGEFPETPGALLNFLENFGNNWNISLFHYRNIGSAYGNILIGIEDFNSDKTKLIKHLDKSGTVFKEESNNRAYLDFLK
jgi:threonine dehydratase